MSLTTLLPPPPVLAPYRSERRHDLSGLTRDARGALAYADENDEEFELRDLYGLPVVRSAPRAPGDTDRAYAAAHPLRQAQLMSELLCQVCGESAAETPDGGTYLWAVPGRVRAEDVAGPALPSLLGGPPVCPRHTAPPCPHLRAHGVTILRAPHEAVAVTAARAYLLNPRTLTLTQETTVILHKPLARRALALELLVGLRAAEVVDVLAPTRVGGT
ncbi:hypothetical protein [Streptomyces sp. NPDC001054]